MFKIICMALVLLFTLASTQALYWQLLRPWQHQRLHFT